MRQWLTGLLLCCAALAMAVPARPAEPAARWRDESALPSGARDALAAERAFATMAREDGLKAAFLEWLVDGATVFGPGPMPVQARFGGLPDAPEAQPALHWLPEWILCAGSQDLAAISGRWGMAAAGAADETVFGQYLSIWRQTPEGWRVLADIGTSQEEARPLTPTATGRVVGPASTAPALDHEHLAAEIEHGLEEDAVRDGYAAALRARALTDVLVLREGQVARLGAEALDVDPAIAGLAPRTELSGSAESAAGDLVATWGLMHFTRGDASERDFVFLRVWEPGPAHWQLAMEICNPLPTGDGS